MALRTVYKYLSAEAVSKKKNKNAMHRRNRSFGLGGDFYFLLIEQQRICCGSMDVYFFVSVDVLES